MNQGATYGNSWVKATCPDCGRGPVATYTTRKPKDGTRVRYHRCKWCGRRFKSVEECGDWSSE